MSTISFDCSGREFDDEEWNEILRRLNSRLSEAGLPNLYGDGWEDSEGGCTFEGRPEEVERLREILSDFPLTINSS